MKKYIPLLLLSLFIFKAGYCQQSFCPAGATWYYGTSAYARIGFSKRAFLKDTTMNGFPGQKISITDSSYSYASKTYAGGTSYSYFYENAGIVYGLFQNGYDTIYNFNASPGDKWHLPVQCNDTNYVFVEDTGRKIINGLSLKFLSVGIKERYGIVSDTIVERIGYLQTDPFYYDYCGVTDIGSGFCSYNDNNITGYPESNSFCSHLPIINGVQNIMNCNSIIVYPNPAHDLITIHNEAGNGDEEVTVFDVAGRVAFSKKLNQKGYDGIDVSDLTAGMYFIVLRAKDEIKRALFVKE